MEIERREVYFRGTVQGVGFRFTARQIATRFAVTGYVKNLPDGRVLLIVEGASDQLDQFLGAVENEMRYAIDDREISTGPVPSGFRQFEIRY